MKTFKIFLDSLENLSYKITKEIEKINTDDINDGDKCCIYVNKEFMCSFIYISDYFKPDSNYKILPGE